MENENVEYVFHLPGEETLAVTDALSKSSVKLITVRHEQAAAFMAGVYGRLTGRAGVCMATLGPGATNLATGIADAHVDRAPLVALTGQASLEHVHKEYHQYVDVVSILHPITKWNNRIQRADTIPEAVRKAFTVAEAEKPGSTHLELPEDVADQITNERPVPLQPGPEQPRPRTSQIKTAAQIINKSETPMVLAGNGIIRAKASEQLRKFLEVTKIPVAHTFMGKGAMPDDNPLSLYAIGLQAQSTVNNAFEQADVVLAIGYDFVEYAPAFWNPRNDKTVVHVDGTSAEVDSNYQPQVQLVGEIGETLTHLTRYAKPRSASYARRLREAIVQETEADSNHDSYPLKPKRILIDLRQALGKSDILVSDVGEHKLWIARYFPTYYPNTVIISNGYSSMGIGIPGAIAAKLVHPNRHVVAVVGDGGFLMTVHELETAVRLGIAITIVIFRDNAYGSIKRKQLARYRKATGVDFQNPDFVQLAQAFKVQGYRPEKASDLLPTLQEALESSKPSIVDVSVDYA